MNPNKRKIVTVLLIFLPFVLISILHLLFYPKQKEIELKERKELFSDTARVNAAHRTYKRVHGQLLLDDTDYLEMHEENEELREKLQRIKSYAEEMEDGLYYFEDKGFDVSDLQGSLDNIISECAD